MTSKLKNLDVSVQDLEVMQWAYKKTQAKTWCKTILRPYYTWTTYTPPTEVMV